ncbi:hypothetical protein CAEBREN_05022 [Caenorhabditis brenneri]|uniref:Domain of unknown function DB domain-containing protein n=1 Tax=Caenorhabditis brenneri TaxID=135651 RepID=G0NNQ5_CAEBE|nr:hypothetical protein CAEBREN_05022 [Caenorhabditis brenneri]
MREKHRHHHLLLLLISVSTVHSQLSCHRIPTSFCCTSRIRDQCPEQCSTVECGNEFIHSLFSTDGSRKPFSSSTGGAHDGNANIGGVGSGDIRGFGRNGDFDPTVTSFEKPDQPAPPMAPPSRVEATWNPNTNSNSGDARIPVETTTFPTTSSSGFPTLIPFSSESWSTVTQAPLAPAPSFERAPEPAPSRVPEIPSTGFTGNFGGAPPTPIPFQPTPRRDGHRRRTTPDPRIIRPPESLVVIGDYDEDEPPSENAVVDSPQPILTSPPPTFFSPTPLPSPTPPVISNSGDVFARSRKEINPTPEFEQQSGTAHTLRDSSVISSSSSLPHFNHLRRFSSRSSSPSFAHSRAHHRLICRLTTPGRLLCNRPMPRLHRSRYVTPPKYWKTSDVRKSSPPGLRIRKKNFATTRIHITPFMGELARKRRKLDSGSSHEWKVSIIPRGQNNKPSGVNSIPPFTIDGKSDERFNKFFKNIDKVINKLELTNSGDLHIREGEPQIRLEGSTKDLSVESSAAVIVPRTTVAPGVTNKVSVIPFRPLHFTAPPRVGSGQVVSNGGPPAIAPGQQCGVAPDFTPCVSNEIASKSLLECCKRKNLPAGCQQLCRYDITQIEIRAAMDRGQCGIFNVAPFLECASQGKDNSECCRHRGIVQKTGPQCEQFCRPAQGLSSLGVQHIVCGNAVGDMLHCHHSGVRI